MAPLCCTLPGREGITAREMAVLLNLDLIKGNAAHAAKVGSGWRGIGTRTKETDRLVNCKLANELVLWTVGSHNINVIYFF